MERLQSASPFPSPPCCQMFRFIPSSSSTSLALFTLELLQPVKQHVILPFTAAIAQ